MATTIARAMMQSAATVVTKLALIWPVSCTTTQVSTIISARNGGSQRRFSATWSGNANRRQDGRVGSSKACPRPTTYPPKHSTPASRLASGASASGRGAAQTSPR